MVPVSAVQHARHVSDGGSAAAAATGWSGASRAVAAGAGVAGAVVLALHLLGAGVIDPVALTVSDYVSIPGGYALLGLAAGGLATAGLVLIRSSQGAGWPRSVPILLVLWCVALTAVAVFPTNAIGADPDLAALVHRWAGAVVFGVPPIAGMLAARGRGAGAAGSSAAGSPSVRSLRNWSIGTALAGIAFLLAHAPTVLAGAPAFALLGAVERVAYLAMLGQLVVFGRCAVPGAGGPAPIGTRPAGEALR